MLNPPQETTTAAQPASGRKPGAAIVSALVLGLIVLAIGWLRAVRVDTVPHGLYDDEASIGYNAFHIQRDGLDENGERMPLYFKSWGDYKSPLFIYSVAGVFRVLGVSDRSLRMTSVLWSLLFVIGVWLLARRVAPGSRAVAVFAALAAGLLPWTFVLSRIAFECNTWLALVCLSFVFVWETFHGPRDRRHWVAALLAGALLAISFYGYATARLMSPLMLVAIWLAYVRRETWREGALVAAPMGVSVLATVVYNLQHPGAVAARFQYLSYLFDPTLSAMNKGKLGIKFYLRHFSPQFLLISGDPNHRHSTGHGGELYIVVAVLALVGIGVWLASRERRDRFLWFVVLGAVLSPVAAALTRESIPHAIRSLLLCLFLLLLSCYGLAFAATRIAPRFRALLWAGVFGMLAVESGVFLQDYFVRYAPISGGYFEYHGAREALEIAGSASPNGPVVFSSSIPAEILHWYQVSLPEAGRREVVYQPPVPAANACVIYDRKKDARVLDAAALPFEERGVPGAPIGMRCYGAGASQRASAGAR